MLQYSAGIVAGTFFTLAMLYAFGLIVGVAVCILAFLILLLI